jgi:acetyl-CoA carboxylase carboxyl transferase subunit alpha
MQTLIFENKILQIDEDIEKLKIMKPDSSLNITKEIERLLIKKDKMLENIYSKLTPWQKFLVARHASRPHTADYIYQMTQDFFPISGDRCYGDDKAIIAGICFIGSQPVVICGHERGHDLSSRMAANFGMAHPEGYRKFMRAAKIADTHGFPLVTLIDTSGAYPGIESEKRGQAYAIAQSMYETISISVPFISVIIGEGGSGGAIAMATANRVLMLEHSVYSVISPEGCAAILWKTADKTEDAAMSQNATAQALISHKLIDEIIEEGIGGAHRNRDATIERVKHAILKNLQELSIYSSTELIDQRISRFEEI